MIYMKLFKNQKREPIPEGYTAESVAIEKSTCTGERTIGFYNPKDKKLVRAELVRTDADIDAFYEKYGIKNKGGKGK